MWTCANTHGKYSNWILIFFFSGTWVKHGRINACRPDCDTDPAFRFTLLESTLSTSLAAWVLHDTLITLTPAKTSRPRCIPCNTGLRQFFEIGCRVRGCGHIVRPHHQLKSRLAKVLKWICLFWEMASLIAFAQSLELHTAVPWHPINWECCQGEINSSGNLLPLQAPANAAYSHKQRVSFGIKTGWTRGNFWSDVGGPSLKTTK